MLDETGKAATLHMGCYGIGVTRVVAAAIEQNHDARGIIWPDAIAPFQVVVVPLNASKSQRVRETAERLYADLLAAGSTCCSTIATSVRASSSRTPSSSAFRTAWSWASAASEQGKLEYRHRRAEAAEEFPPADALAVHCAGKLG